MLALDSNEGVLGGLSVILSVVGRFLRMYSKLGSQIVDLVGC
jgi:hypothetical protein